MTAGMKSTPMATRQHGSNRKPERSTPSRRDPGLSYHHRGDSRLELGRLSRTGSSGNLSPALFVTWSNYGMLRYELAELPHHRPPYPGVPVLRRHDDARAVLVAVGRTRHRPRLGADPHASDAHAVPRRRAGRPRGHDGAQALVELVEGPI